MNNPDFKVDLTNCDREPIHQLGAIQPFGAMMIVTGDGLLAHHSTNLWEYCGFAEPVEQGAPVFERLGKNAARRIREAVPSLSQTDHVERLFALDLLGDGRLFDCAIHMANAGIVLDLERHDPDGERAIATVRPMIARIGRAGSPQELCEMSARQLKGILGFDRVMVYKFHTDGSGEVIAEARESAIEPFLSLRYPRSDIPEQARALYLRNRFRLISDVADTPVGIEPARTTAGEPVDLSLSMLRSVSPIHIEYLKNMGVRASLSISIVIDGKLWGMFACHHYAPRRLSFGYRTLAELYSDFFSMALDGAIARQNRSRDAVGRQLHERLMSRVASGDSISDAFADISDTIDEIIPHDGTSLFIDGEYTHRGRAPGKEEFKSIVPALNTSPTSNIFAHDALPERIPAAAAFADRATGALVVPVSRSPRDYFVLWRREVKQTVTWAGNPAKPAEPGPNGDRLTPRKSFAAWQEEVAGRSQPWTASEIALAESIRVSLLEVILRITDETAMESKRAQEKQELLIAELNHRVRNILNLIRGLISQSRFETSDPEALVDLIGGRVKSLATAHDNITRENWNAASVKGLIRNEAEAYLTGQNDRIAVEGADCLVSPEAYTVLALVIHEMMTNSAKYGSLSDSSGNLSIGLEYGEYGQLTITWKERGGPPVKSPERRGFGTTIIETSIPHELGGTAQIDYNLSGVEAEFEVPERYIQPCPKGGYAEDEARDTQDAAGDGTQDDTALSLPGHVLLVEDSMIIALDVEHMLGEIGVGEVTTVATVSQALKAIEDKEPQFAILDYNLGDETSDPIARELGAREVPFVLATGYGQMADKSGELGARGILTKPYDMDELRGLFAGT